MAESPFTGGGGDGSTDTTGDDGSDDTEATSDVPSGRQRARIPVEEPSDPDPSGPSGGDPDPIPDPIGGDPPDDGDTTTGDETDNTGGTQPGGGDTGGFMGEPAPIPDPVGGDPEPSPTTGDGAQPGAGGGDRGGFMGEPEPISDPVGGDAQPDPEPESDGVGSQPDYGELQRAKASDAEDARQRALEDALELEDTTIDYAAMAEGYPTRVPDIARPSESGTAAVADFIANADIDEDIADAATRGGFSRLPLLPTIDLETPTRATQEFIEDRELGFTTTTVETPIVPVPVGVSVDLGEEETPDTPAEEFTEGALGVAIPTAYAQDAEDLAEAADNPGVYARNPAATFETTVGAGRDAGEQLTVAARRNPYGVAGALTAGLAGVGVGAVSAARGTGSITRALSAEIDPRVGPFGTTLETRGVRAIRDRLPDIPVPGDERGMAQLPTGRRPRDVDSADDVGETAQTDPVEITAEDIDAPMSDPEQQRVRPTENFETPGEGGGPQGFAGGSAETPEGFVGNVRGADPDSIVEGYDAPTPTIDTDASAPTTGLTGGTLPGSVGSALFGTRAIEVARTPTVGDPTTDLDVQADGQPVPVVDPGADPTGLDTDVTSDDYLLTPVTDPGTVGVTDADSDTTTDVVSDTDTDVDVFTGLDTDITTDTDQPTDVDQPEDVDQPTDTDQRTPPDTDVPPIDLDTPQDTDQRDPRDPDRPFDPSDPPDRDIDIPLPDDDRDDKKRRRRQYTDLDTDVFENPTISPEEALEFDPLED